MYRKKNATLADDVGCPMLLSLKLSSTATSIMQMPSPKLPIIMGRRRPSLSAPSAGTMEPSGNMICVTPAMRSDMLRVMPTLDSNTVGR